MTKQTLAAALNLAFQVAAQDGFQEEETWALAREVKSFNLSQEDGEEVLQLYRTLSAYEAMDIIRNADQATKDETQALIFLTMINDRVIDPSESTAYFNVCNRCGLGRDLTINEAHEILGF